MTQISELLREPKRTVAPLRADIPPKWRSTSIAQNPLTRTLGALTMTFFGGRMRIFTLGLCLGLTAGAAQAATLHNISVRAQCGAIPAVDNAVLQTTPQTKAISAGSPLSTENCAASANAFVGDGTIRTLARIANSGADDSLKIVRGAAGASGWLSYSFRVNATGFNPNPNPLTLSVNMNATGTAFASSNKLISDTGAFLNSGQIVSSVVRAFGTLSSGGESTSFEETASARANPGEVDSNGLSGAFTTGTISVRPGALVSFSFGLDTSTFGQLFGAKAVGEVRADRSLSFAMGGPVFNVPDGYLIEFEGDSPLVNNRYFGPDGPPDDPVDPVDPVDPIDPLTPVPLPAAGWALLTALMGLVALKRRRRVA